MNKILMILAVVMMGCGGVTGPSEPYPTPFDYGWPENPALYPLDFTFAIPYGSWAAATNIETLWVGTPTCEFEIVDEISSDYNMYFHYEYCYEYYEIKMWLTYTGENAFTMQVSALGETVFYEIVFPGNEWSIPFVWEGCIGYNPSESSVVYCGSIHYPYQK